jgi:hypothetical protein
MLLRAWLLAQGWTLPIDDDLIHKPAPCKCRHTGEERKRGSSDKTESGRREERKHKGAIEAQPHKQGSTQKLQGAQDGRTVCVVPVQTTEEVEAARKRLKNAKRIARRTRERQRERLSKRATSDQEEGGASRRASWKEKERRSGPLEEDCIDDGS